jgi:branched-chain amino acid transport system ATP-binding protein
MPVTTEAVTPAVRPEAAQLAGSQITVQFAGLVALDSVDIEIRRGEVLGLIGPNGAGKTTLLNVLTGFNQPRSGAVLFGDRAITGMAPYRRARLGVGRSFQGARIFPSLTVAENVEVGARSHHRSGRATRQAVTDALERVGLDEHRDTLAGALPFGAERMLGLARVMAMRPAFVLLDEPAAGLNEEESDELGDVILRMRDEDDAGVLIVEHDMRLIMSLCDRIHVLSFGRTICIGTPEHVRNDPVVRDAYLGEPAA